VPSVIIVAAYFIECERRAKQAPSAPLIPQTLPDALRLTAELAEQKADPGNQARCPSPQSPGL